MRPDPAKRLRRRRGRVQVARCRSARRARAALAKENDPAVKRGAAARRAPPSCSTRPTRPKPTRLAAIDAAPRARRPGCAGAASSAAGRTRPPRSRRRPTRRRLASRTGSRFWAAAAERLVRAVARLGAAARRHRACHHLRRDGRHQHGAWRDGDARRLHDLRRAGGRSAAQAPGAVRLFARRSPSRSPSWSRAPSASPSSAASSASSTAARSRRCSRPGASR